MKAICSKLVEDIHFAPDKICPCSSFNWVKIIGAEVNALVKLNKNTNPDVILAYFDIRKACIEDWLQGKIPQGCENCFMYKPYYGTSYNSIRRIYVNHRINCRCKCIYCCLTDGGKEKRHKLINQYEPYDIRPFLKHIEQNFNIDDTLRIDVLGGECTEYPEELNDIIDFGRKYNAECSFYTNGIIFNEKICQYLKDGKCEVFISLDSGSEEIFNKVKRVNAFSQVTENIAKYSEAAFFNETGTVHLKYILVPDVNDSIDEVKKFFQFASDNDISSVILSINKFWLEAHYQEPCPEHLKNVIKYFLQNEDYWDIEPNVDYSFLWQSWLEKILNEDEDLS